MKMNSVPIISRNNRSRFPSVFKILFFLAILLAIFYFFFPSFFSSVFTSLVRPFWNIERTVKYGDGFVPIADIIKENEELKKKISTNENRYVGTASLISENNELKSMMGRAESTKTVLAEILKKPPFSAYDTFILDIGQNKGIEKGALVYALGNIPIGEIAEVSGGSSKVRLYSSDGQRFDVLIGPNNIEAVAVGRGGGAFETSLPRDAKINKGDAVSIPSLNNNFVANVDDIAISSQPFSKIFFRQPLNIYEQRWVLVKVN